MLLGVDVWEGSLDIDEGVLIQAGVKYIIVRLNNMNGGHHKDANFDDQWLQAEPFLRAPYFVYNPWVTGKLNAEWLLDNLPSKGVTRIFPDVEVKYPDYEPVTYAQQVAIYKTEIAKYIKYPQVCYTGQWFLSYLSYWPIDWEYWWARYPWALYPAQKQNIPWDTLRLMIDAVGWNPDPQKKCPGIVKLWQCTADRYILPGCAGRPMDMIVALMTQPELTSWWGAEAPVNKLDILWREAQLRSWNLNP
jgi:hypothetical protein